MASIEHKGGDPFDSLLTLEDQYYTEGYTLGLSDGAKAGRIEGRLFGLKNGFDKHLELGRLGGRAAVWQARIQLSNSNSSGDAGKILPLELSERSTKHISRLRELTDASTLSTENSEDAVEEFESRLRDAKAKALLISNLKVVGESERSSNADDGEVGEAGGKGRRLKVTKALSANAGSGEMEDFAGSVPIVRSKATANEDAG